MPTKQSQLWRIIQRHIDNITPYGYRISEAQIARQMGVSRQTLYAWKSGKGMPTKKHLKLIATMTGTPYPVVLHAALTDKGLDPPPFVDHEEATTITKK